MEPEIDDSKKGNLFFQGSYFTGSAYYFSESVTCLSWGTKNQAGKQGFFPKKISKVDSCQASNHLLFVFVFGDFCCFL